MAGPINYPLRFEPILMERIWGGRRLEQVFGKTLPTTRAIGESWEISDCGERTSVIANGPLLGQTLREIVADSPQSFFTNEAADRAGPAVPRPDRFPLLVKWIDARERLSIQVHPCDGHPRLKPGECGKSECWFVVDAAPNAEIYAGLKRGIDRATLVRELARGTIDHCLNAFPARPGDFYYLSAGTVHAIGDGILIAEVQQSSDVTFRLFDWNRLDRATGRPRELHIDAALDSIDFQQQPRPLAVPRAGESAATQALMPPGAPFAVAWRRMVAVEPLGERQRFHVLMGLNGAGEISGGNETTPIRAGDSLLLPAGAGPFDCRPLGALELLDVWLP